MMTLVFSVGKLTEKRQEMDAWNSMRKTWSWHRDKFRLNTELFVKYGNDLREKRILKNCLFEKIEQMG